MQKAIQFRAYPNREQKNVINKTLGCSRFVYNHFLNIRKTEYEENGKSVGYLQTARMLTELKKELPWLAEVDAVALQQSLRNLDMAYSRFFKGESKYPQFKRKHDRQSYRTLNQGNKIKIVGRKIYIPKVGFVKIRQSLEIGEIKNVTVIRTKTNRYFVPINYETEVAPLPTTDKTVGIDLNYRNIATFDDGTIVENPKWLHTSQKKINREQRRLARKKKGSKNREKQRLRLAIAHERIANQRRDFTQKLTTQIIRENQAIYLEDLKVREMQKNHHIAKYINDVGLYEFRRQIMYKAEWYGRKAILIDKDFPSSKMCSKCGHINEKLGSQEYWTCPSCGERHHRDINAAKNIKREGERIA